MRKAAIAFAAILIVITLLPLIPSNEWWIRIFDFPRAQIAVLIVGAIVLVLLSGLFGRNGGKLLTTALAICFVYQAVRIYPYTPLAPVEVARAEGCGANDRLRYMEANVLQDNRRSAALLALVRQQRPDVLLLTETDPWWAEQVAPLRAEFPHVVSVPLPNTYGMMLFSKLPLVAPEVRYLFEPDIPSIRAGLRLRSGERVQFYAVHPKPPVPGEDTEDRDAEIVIVGREVRRQAEPAIVGGDFNDVAWSDTTSLFQEVSGLLDPRVGRSLYPTYPVALPLLRWPLDYVFVSPGFTLNRLARLPDIGSDHFPILADFCTADLDRTAMPTPALDAEVKAEVNETVKEGVEGEE